MNPSNAQRGIRIFFLDDNYVDYKERVAYCYGGYFYEGDLKELDKVIAKKKRNNKLKEWMPIKWNFSDKLKDYYKKLGDEIFNNFTKKENFDSWWENKLKPKSERLRKELVQQKIGSIKILFSVFFDKKGCKNVQYVRGWMIENLFQRIGLNMMGTSLNILMCDYEHKKSEAKKILEKQYFYAYYTAERYYSGPLKERGGFPSLVYSST